MFLYRAGNPRASISMACASRIRWWLGIRRCPCLKGSFGVGPSWLLSSRWVVFGRSTFFSQGRHFSSTRSFRSCLRWWKYPKPKPKHRGFCSDRPDRWWSCSFRRYLSRCWRHGWVRLTRYLPFLQINQRHRNLIVSPCFWSFWSLN